MLRRGDWTPIWLARRFGCSPSMCETKTSLSKTLARDWTPTRS